MSFVTLNCPICGRFHGSCVHGAADSRHFSSLIAANTNFKSEAMPTERKRMSAREAMERTKVRYKETLDYLT